MAKNKKICKYCGAEGIIKVERTFANGTHHWQHKCKTCGKHRKFVHRNRKISNIYEDRQTIIESLGFVTYNDYLQSDLWKDIRTKRLRKDGHKCKICKNPATQVHHIDYTIKNLSGGLIDLRSICAACHYAVEFYPNGKRRNLDAQQKNIKKFIKWGKVDYKMCPDCKKNKCGNKEVCGACRKIRLAAKVKKRRNNK